MAQSESISCAFINRGNANSKSNKFFINPVLCVFNYHKGGQEYGFLFGS
jgi:hypothetical protein